MRWTLGMKFGAQAAGASGGDGRTRSTEVRETLGFERCVVETMVRLSTLQMTQTTLQTLYRAGQSREYKLNRPSVPLLT